MSRWTWPTMPGGLLVLPHVLAFSAPNALDVEPRIAAALGATTAVDGLPALRDRADISVGLPRALKAYGMPETCVARLLGPAKAAIPTNNPTPVTDENLTALLRGAWEGPLP